MDAVDRMFCDAGQDGTEIEFRIESVELGAADQRVDVGGPVAARIRAREQVILISPSQSDGAQRALGAGVVDLDQSIIDIAGESA